MYPCSLLSRQGYRLKRTRTKIQTNAVFSLWWQLFFVFCQLLGWFRNLAGTGVSTPTIRGHNPTTFCRTKTSEFTGLPISMTGLTLAACCNLDQTSVATLASELASRWRQISNTPSDSVFPIPVYRNDWHNVNGCWMNWCLMTTPTMFQLQSYRAF